VNWLYDIREQQKKTSTEYAAPDISATNTCISTIFLVTRAFLPDLKKYQWCLYFFSLEMLELPKKWWKSGYILLISYILTS